MGKHDHEHIEASGNELAAAAKVALEKGGEQWTEMRAQVFDAIAGLGQPTSAYDITDIVSKSRGRRVAPNSVYRILDLFVANNVVRRVESANAFIANSHPGCLHDCVFLICDDCGATTHVDDDALSKSVRATAAKAGFTAERPVLEVRGKCGDCQ
ncbi:MAG: transcriptional repressor [Sphingopyxis sp.]|nr:transcriptional repressor [Sphingopyxis sp.]